MCENYLISAHENDILMILEDPEKEKHFSVYINFLELFESDTNLGNALLTDPENSLKNWNEAVFIVQSNLLKEVDKKCTIKNNVNCRIYSLPPWPHVCRTIFPGNDDTEKFLQVTGTVVRMSARKLLEYQRQYICTKCKYPITVEANYDKLNIIKAPRKCSNPEGCLGKNIIAFGELDPYNCKDYQEIKIQEDLSKMGVGMVPNHMIITLEDDLVNICKPGENITITGIVKRRWSEFDKGVKMTVDIVLRANHVQVNNSSGLSIAVSDDLMQFFDNFWMKYRHDPLVGRNIIVKSISPEIYGRELVKLAMAMVLAGGSPNEEDPVSTGIDRRSESHLLLVGDPGTGKSQMLKFAAKIVPRSVLTTGVGSTAAGLTVTALMEKGEWQLEAGALVMADGGICCIDEFNSMKEHDRTSIHEAMEQQTISVAKAGIVCKLKTRCSILAACNPKGNIDPSQPLCVNVAMSSPLLSRFDLILLLRDIVNEENDKKLAEFLLNIDVSEGSDENKVWGLEKLQAYFAVIKKNCPKLTNEAETILSNYYQLQRKFGSRNKSRTTVRLLESLIRLSQGHAKLIYHSEVEVIDTIFAIILVDAALDHDSSVFNLNIDYASFFDEPETQYWNLLETILGKLNLDYIYQREVEKMGIKIVDVRKGSQNSGSQKISDSSSNLGESMVISQCAITSTQNQINHSAETTLTRANKSKLLFTRGNILSQSTSEVLEIDPPKGPKLLFSQRALRQKLNESSSLGTNSSQSNSATFEKTSPQKVPKLLFSQKRFNQKSVEISNGEPNDNSSQISRNSPQKRPKLLFSQRSLSQKSVEECSASNNPISQIAGQVYDNIKRGAFGDSNRNDDSGNVSQDSSPFSIFQNRNNSFKRNQVMLNTEPGTSYKKMKDPQKIDLKDDSTKKRLETKKKNTFLKSVKSSDILNMDLDGFFDNMMQNTSKMPLKKNVDKTKGEESGFSSQSTSGKNTESQDSTLRVINSDQNNTEANVYSDVSVKEKNKRNRTSKKSKKGDKNELINEADFLKLLPSVNDDFKKYGLDIDWNMQENSDEDVGKDEEDTNESPSNTKTNVNEKNSSLKTEGNNLAGNIIQTKKVSKFSDLCSKFEYEPKEKNQQENYNSREKCTEGNNDKTVLKQNIYTKSNESREIKEKTPRKILEDNNDLNMALSIPVDSKSPKRFKYEITEPKNFLNATTKSEIKKSNFKRISSINFAALDEDIRSFEFDGNIENPFTRKSSSCSSKDSFTDGDKAKQTCDSGQNGTDADDKCSSTNFFKKGVEKEISRNNNPPSLESLFGDIDNFNIDSVNLGNKNKKNNVQEPKHELFDLTQNSRKQFIRNKFTFKKLDIKKMRSENIPNE